MVGLWVWRLLTMSDSSCGVKRPCGGATSWVKSAAAHIIRRASQPTLALLVGTQPCCRTIDAHSHQMRELHRQTSEYRRPGAIVPIRKGGHLLLLGRVGREGHVEQRRLVAAQLLAWEEDDEKRAVALTTASADRLSAPRMGHHQGSPLSAAGGSPTRGTASCPLGSPRCSRAGLSSWCKCHVRRPLQ